jgi:transcriptional regulator with XRE-family HTH domain
MPQNPLRVLGQNIRRIRKESRLTQEDVSDKAHLNSSYFGRIERGEMNVTIETLMAIAQALNVDVSELFDSEASSVDVARLHAEIGKAVKRLDTHGLRLIRDLLTHLAPKN